MLPRISVITPSFNQGAFLEQTILSVIGQGYPNLEYFIFDGGSTDNSVEIIKRYERHLTYWESGPDGGQASAINKGFHRATGEILCWLNSDDMYMPGALFLISSILANQERPSLVFGNCLHFREDNPEHVRGSDVIKNHKTLSIDLVDYIIQPSSFWNRAAWEAVGALDDNMHYVFDWDWFIRCKKADVTFITTTKILSLYRIHGGHKSRTGADKRTTEILSIYSRYNSPLQVKALSRIWNVKNVLRKNRILAFLFNRKRFLFFLLFKGKLSFGQFNNIWRVR